MWACANLSSYSFLRNENFSLSLSKIEKEAPNYRIALKTKLYAHGGLFSVLVIFCSIKMRGKTDLVDDKM